MNKEEILRYYSLWEKYETVGLYEDEFKEFCRLREKAWEKLKKEVENGSLS